MLKYVLVIIVLISFALFLLVNIPSPIKIQGDGVFYYSYLHSVMFDHDLNFKNELEHFSKYDYFSQQFVEQDKLTSAGKTPNAYAWGVGLMWLPFVFIAHLLTLFFSGLADGFSVFYVWAVNFGSWFYGMLALLLVWRILKKFFNDKIALLSSLVIWLATPWIYYQFFEPSMSHMASLFLVAGFLWLLVRQWKGQKASAWLVALVIFLMIATRWQNAIFLLAYLPRLSAPTPSPLRGTPPRAGGGVGGWYAFGHKPPRPHSARPPLLGKEGLRRWLVLIVPIAVFAIMQMALWHYLYGVYLLVPQGHQFVGYHFYGLRTLLSSDRGLFLWSPVLILAVAGWWELLKKSKFLGWMVLLVFVFQWLINSSLNDPGGGDAFGARRFIELMPFLAIALTALLEKARRFKWQMITLIVILILGNGLLIQNYRHNLIPRSGEFKFFQHNYFQIWK